MGIDDTDSVHGGCTTHVLTELVGAARDREIDLVGLPRLVRLNPNVPWKTRGNAALSARFGHGYGRRRTVGSVGNQPVFSYPRGHALSRAESVEWFEKAWEIVLRLSRAEEDGTDPALVATPIRAPSEIYWKAVREIVRPDASRRWITSSGGWFRTERSDRGLVGALAGIAWPGRRRTFELLAYRSPARFGSPRLVDAASVRRAQARWPSLFLCYDARTRRLMVAPHTPCPILFGLRSRTAGAPVQARPMIRSEAVDRWMLFATNQGTGDHLVRRGAADIPPYTSAAVLGTVAQPPRVRPGGHAALALRDDLGAELDCIAFEPTKTLPRVVRSLARGDRVRVWGSRHEDPLLRLEGIEIVRWNLSEEPLRGPICAACGRRAKSMGRLRGYRCSGCARRWPPEIGESRRRRPPFPPGVYHPTPSARRHLAPLGPEARMDRDSRL